MSSRAEKRKMMQQLLADYNGMNSDDASSVISQARSLRIKSSGSVQLQDKKQSSASKRSEKIDETPVSSAFNQKPSYKWLYEPDKFRKIEFDDGKFREWLKTFSNRKSVKYTKYNLLMQLLSHDHPFPNYFNSFSTNDLSNIPERRFNVFSSVSNLPNSSLNFGGPTSPSTSNNNLRSIANQQAQQLKTHVIGQQQRRLSGSLTNLAVIRQLDESPTLNYSTNNLTHTSISPPAKPIKSPKSNSNLMNTLRHRNDSPVKMMNHAATNNNSNNRLASQQNHLGVGTTRSNEKLGILPNRPVKYNVKYRG